MNNRSLPRITFGIIVLNGEPFVRCNLRSLYSFAHEIIVVEGGSPNAAADTTEDGHSVDGSLETLLRFKAEEDPEDKMQIITRETFWTEKDEQSKAYTERATGDYIWQVDVDEFYHPEDIEKILKMLASNPSISGVSFYWQNFWGGFDYLVDGWRYRSNVKKMNGNRRIFKWGKGFKYVSHRPPTVVDNHDRDLCTLAWVGPEETAKMGIFCFHYGMVFPKHARQKVNYYKRLVESCKDMEEWYYDTYIELKFPFRVLHCSKAPSWLHPFKGTHPPEIQQLIEDCTQGKLNIEQRRCDDIEQLLSSRRYQISAILLDRLYYVVMPVWQLINPKTMLNYISAAFKNVLSTLKKIWGRVWQAPLESLPNTPDLFRVYRSLHGHPDLERSPGGWVYRGRFNPDYLTVGGAAHAIFPEALKFCQGTGIDVGAGLWGLPGAVLWTTFLVLTVWNTSRVGSKALVNGSGS
jgi:glycosyltransferase involved in cell wall biosynthesis